MRCRMLHELRALDSRRIVTKQYHMFLALIKVFVRNRLDVIWSAVVSRILLKNESAGTMGNLTNIQVEVSTVQTLLTLHNCKSKQEC